MFPHSPSFDSTRNLPPPLHLYEKKWGFPNISPPYPLARTGLEVVVPAAVVILVEDLADVLLDGLVEDLPGGLVDDVLGALVDDLPGGLVDVLLPVVVLAPAAAPLLSTQHSSTLRRFFDHVYSSWLVLNI